MNSIYAHMYLRQCAHIVRFDRTRRAPRCMAATNSSNGSGPPTVIIEPLSIQPIYELQQPPRPVTSNPDKLVATLEEYDIPTLQGENEKWGIWAVYVLWIAYVMLQLFRPELTDNYGLPEAVCDVLESGAMVSAVYQQSGL